MRIATQLQQLHGGNIDHELWIVALEKRLSNIIALKEPVNVEEHVPWSSQMSLYVATNAITAQRKNFPKEGNQRKENWEQPNTISLFITSLLFFLKLLLIKFSYQKSKEGICYRTPREEIESKSIQNTTWPFITMAKLIWQWVILFLSVDFCLWPIKSTLHMFSCYLSTYLL